MAVMYRYRLFGLTVASEFELSGLARATAGPVDVTIRRGPAASGEGVEIEGVARYAVREGREIVVDAAPGIPPRNVQLYLLGSVMGLLLHQRGAMPLHAAAVEVDGRALLVLGVSGAGKSTLAAWFHRQGFRLIADDVSVVEPAGGAQPTVRGGAPRVRLWGEALRALRVQGLALQRAYAGDEWDKWDVALPEQAMVPDGLLLSGIYVLEDNPEVHIETMTGLAAAEAVFAHTYCGEYLTSPGAVAGHWRRCMQVIATVPLFQLMRPRDLTRLDALGEALLGHARSEPIVRTAAAAR